MEISTVELIRIAVGLVVLKYVNYCLFKQKVWVRGDIGWTSKKFAWGTREENPTLFMIHVIVGYVIGIWILAGLFLW